MSNSVFRREWQKSIIKMLVFKYLKSCCVDNRDITTFICLDDEAIIPVGEPGIPKVLKDITKFLPLLMVHVWCVLIMISMQVALFHPWHLCPRFLDIVTIVFTSEKQQDPVYILWTNSFGNSIPENKWKLNHFVVLLPLEPVTVKHSYEHEEVLKEDAG